MSLLVSLILFLAFELTQASVDHHGLRQRQSGLAERDSPNLPAYTIDMPIDHFNSSDKRTFRNRYWFNATYYKPGGPVLLVDQGEAGVTASIASDQLAEAKQSQPQMQLARKYNAMVILLEHRYYGLSIPFPLALNNGTAVDPVTSAKAGKKCTHNVVGGPRNYKYLTLEQAMEDTVYFAKNFRPEGFTAEQQRSMAPENTPWIFHGCSYAGTRAAIARIRNPDIFYAAWAASAPVEASIDGSLYYKVAERALPQTCKADVVAAVKYADDIMSGNKGQAAYSSFQKLVYTAMQTQSDKHAAFDIADAASLTPNKIAGWLLGGVVGDLQNELGPVTLNLFCNYVESYNPAGKPLNSTTAETKILSNPGDGKPSNKGVAASYDLTVLLNAYVYAARRTHFKTSKDADPADDYVPISQGKPDRLTSEQADRKLVAKPESSKSSDPEFDDDSDDASWSWTINSAFGIYMGSNTSNLDNSIVSRFKNVTNEMKNSRESFSFPDSQLPFKKPNVTTFNKYGGWNMNPSNTMFTTGEFDPWSAYSVMSQETQAGAPNRKVINTVPKCNVAPAKSEVFGIRHSNLTHCRDVSGPLNAAANAGTPMQKSVELFEKALDVWLPCFKQSKSTGVKPLQVADGPAVDTGIPTTIWTPKAWSVRFRWKH